jgi:hypothetical protein
MLPMKRTGMALARLKVAVANLVRANMVCHKGGGDEKGANGDDGEGYDMVTMRSLIMMVMGSVLIQTRKLSEQEL